MLGFIALFAGYEEALKSSEQLIAAEKRRETAEQATQNATADLSSTLGNLDKTTKEVSRVQSLNTELQKQLLSSNNQIAQLARTAIDTTVGGDSFSYLSFISFNSQGAKPVVIHQGRYTLYSLTAKIFDLGVIANLSRAGQVPSVFSPIVWDIGELPTKSANIRAEPIPFRAAESEKQDFDVFFSARNGFWWQLVRLRRIDRKWVMATRVYSMPGDGSSRKILFEKIAEDFPKLPNGDVDWGEQK